MARWSDPIKVTDYRKFSEFLDRQPGCYRTGYRYRGEFFPKYIGRTNNLARRMREYNDIEKCHNIEIWNRIYAQRSNLWFCVIRTPRHHGLEARQQRKHGIKRHGVYQWNLRLERKYLLA